MHFKLLLWWWWISCCWDFDDAGVVLMLLLPQSLFLILFLPLVLLTLRWFGHDAVSMVEYHAVDVDVALKQLMLFMLRYHMQIKVKLLWWRYCTPCCCWWCWGLVDIFIVEIVLLDDPIALVVEMLLMKLLWCRCCLWLQD